MPTKLGKGALVMRRTASRGLLADTPQQECSAVAQLELCNLQLHALAADPGSRLEPYETDAAWIRP